MGQQVLCWGSNADGQLGVPVSKIARTSVPVAVDVGGKATAIVVGASHTCAILSDGKIKCWGSNVRGQLGRGTIDPSATIADVVAPTSNLSAWTSHAAETLIAGKAFTCTGMRATRPNEDRVLFCWGDNSTGQIGLDASSSLYSAYPLMVTMDGARASSGLVVDASAAGTDFACAGYGLAAGAGLYTAIGCWGGRASGQIGSPPMPSSYEVNPTKYPSTRADGASAPLYGPYKVAMVAAGSAHGCARIEKLGESAIGIDCWGNNTRGQTGSATIGIQPATQLIGFDAAGVSLLVAGGQNTCIVQASQAKCIGANDLGQLGRGTISGEPFANFANVKLPPTVSVLSVGTNHSCAVLGVVAGQPGPVACWGQNESGQLGDGMNIETGYNDESSATAKRVRATPVRVSSAVK